MWLQPAVIANKREGNEGTLTTDKQKAIWDWDDIDFERVSNLGDL